MNSTKGCAALSAVYLFECTTSSRHCLLFDLVAEGCTCASTEWIKPVRNESRLYRDIVTPVALFVNLKDILINASKINNARIILENISGGQRCIKIRK